MTIQVSNINTAGAVVTIGGTILNNPDADGFYWGTVSGTEIGCTEGGITVKYAIDKKDIYCDQVLIPVAAALTGETATVHMKLLETEADNLIFAIQQGTLKDNAGVESKIDVGGLQTFTYTPLKLEITDNDTGKLTTWTFFKVLAQGIDINFERDNPTAADVTFTAYADMTHAAGHRLFSIHQDLTT